MLNLEGLKSFKDALRDGVLEALALRDTPAFKLFGVAPSLTDAAIVDDIPTRWELCCKWEARKVTPVDFISYPVFDNASANNFPPNTAELYAGSNVSAEYHAVQCGLYKIRCGAGPDAREVFCDLTPGRFALGPQTYVEVYAARWGNAALVPAGLAPIVIRSAIGPSDGTGDYLPYTIPVVVAAATTIGARAIVPPGARYVDISAQQAQIGVSTIVLYTAVGAVMQRDYLTPNFNPGLGTPVPITTGLLDFRNAGATALTVANPGLIKFWCAA